MDGVRLLRLFALFTHLLLVLRVGHGHGGTGYADLRSAVVGDTISVRRGLGNGNGLLVGALVLMRVGVHGHGAGRRRTALGHGLPAAPVGGGVLDDHDGAVAQGLVAPRGVDAGDDEEEEVDEGEDDVEGGEGDEEVLAAAEGVVAVRVDAGAVVEPGVGAAVHGGVAGVDEDGGADADAGYHGGGEGYEEVQGHVGARVDALLELADGAGDELGGGPEEGGGGLGELVSCQMYKIHIYRCVLRG